MRAVEREGFERYMYADRRLRGGYISDPYAGG
jgi:hypothetical protein